jgi:hypothetical protein
VLHDSKNTPPFAVIQGSVVVILMGDAIQCPCCEENV